MEELVLSVLIVNYNDKENLSRCLASIQSGTEAISHEIIVVDNDSSDGSREFIRESYPDVRLICNSENVGFAWIEVKENYEVNGVLDKVRNKVNAISTFPVDAEKPIISESIL